MTMPYRSTMSCLARSWCTLPQHHAMPRPSRSVFLQALRIVFSLPANWTSLPPMPADTGPWSLQHAWAMPAVDYVDFMRFAR